ncbi:helix-turn-helix transcriptional regulator [Oricola sp.]|uniref:helix-turn-helix domain-containing protein n=1 Tax=Oricola sp. TaxID=1979950 RepID=UPI0025EAF44F|nr:helix-turn-helix transcriptional regulator [Oricola sp.]MCI5076411.1 helix-turn-helix domain-containing protein [Oricola sp.]
MQASYDLLRAARVALDIPAAELAKRAGVSKRSLVRIEACEPVALETSLRVQKALEDAGVEFLPETKKEGPGLRVKKGVVRKVGFQIE